MRQTPCYVFVLHSSIADGSQTGCHLPQFFFALVIMKNGDAGTFRQGFSIVLVTGTHAHRPLPRGGWNGRESTGQVFAQPGCKSLASKRLILLFIGDTWLFAHGKDEMIDMNP